MDLECSPGSERMGLLTEHKNIKVERCGSSGLTLGGLRENVYPFCRDSVQGKMFFFLLGLRPVCCLLTVSSLREQAGQGVLEAVCCRFLPSTSRGLCSDVSTVWAARPPRERSAGLVTWGGVRVPPGLGFSPPVSRWWFHRSAPTPPREPDFLALCPASRRAQ